VGVIFENERSGGTVPAFCSSLPPPSFRTFALRLCLSPSPTSSSVIKLLFFRGCAILKKSGSAGKVCMGVYRPVEVALEATRLQNTAGKQQPRHARHQPMFELRSSTFPLVSTKVNVTSFCGRGECLQDPPPSLSPPGERGTDMCMCVRG